MMREFESIARFVEHLAAMAVLEAEAERHALEKAAELLEKKVKEKFGSYQDGAGPFVAWAELAESTKADRVAQGYSENEPLLRSGELRDSVEHQVSDGEAAIGSNSDIAVYQELGTSTIPPRSTFGIAAVENKDHVVEIIGKGVALALAGEEVFAGAIEVP